MFSLIITIISIALVAALALATLYYGGSAFNKGQAGAKAAQLINEGQQVNGAVTIYNADLISGDTTAVTDVAGLVTAKYLSQAPASFGGAAALADGEVTVATTEAVCDEVTKRGGSETGVFGCRDNAGTPEFFYKF